MEIREIEAKSALNELKRRGLPYKYDLNIYRGCSNGCKYCYAESSHKYLGSDSFQSEIFVKTNIADELEKTLSSPNWNKDIINIGGVCDSYQGVEKKYKIMRDILKIMIKYKNPIIISTKSDLILRDLDLIDELASYTYVNVALSITSINNDISKKVEPGASLPIDRLKALSEVGTTKAHTGFHLMPILPFLCDDEHSLESMVKWASEAKVDYMLTGMLYLTCGIKKRYLSFINEHYSEYYDRYCKLYPKGGADKIYKSRIHQFLSKMRQKYNVNNQYSKFLPR
ncbi:SPL family radical SAM protein [Brassicibacter mesophilus]|uniref:SPL family radical SAM protein n=1 Tax=Brassicibacter mesophilus TaxID=745119 RepID=UPI003D237E27